MRRIEERVVFPNGISTEWEPWEDREGRFRTLNTDSAFRAAVRKLNAEAKASGSMERYRSVEEREE